MRSGFVKTEAFKPLYGTNNGAELRNNLGLPIGGLDRVWVGPMLYFFVQDSESQKLYWIINSKNDSWFDIESGENIKALSDFPNKLTFNKISDAARWKYATIKKIKLSRPKAAIFKQRKDGSQVWATSVYKDLVNGEPEILLKDLPKLLESGLSGSTNQSRKGHRSHSRQRLHRSTTTI